MTNLKELYIFAGFQNDFLDKVINSSKKINFKAGDIIFRQGDISNDAYVLTKGIVSVIIGGENINTIFEGDIFGEIGLIMKEPRSASIRAETDIETLVINRETLSEILRKTPDGDYIKTTILNRIIQNNKIIK